MMLAEQDLCLPQRMTVTLPTGTLTILPDSSNQPLDSLCGFAARNNPKRGFLFVSKVLGKHYPVNPGRMQAIHDLLADKLPATLPGPVLFIAMAETATGLGQGVFESFLSRTARTDALFIHSTRYLVTGLRALAFQESHSHATDFYLYEPAAAHLREKFLTARTLVLIDDELSTGNTFVNLISAYGKVNPHLEAVRMVSITNFMGRQRQNEISAAVSVPLEFAQLYAGEYKFETNARYHFPAVASASGNGAARNGGLSLAYGRAGIDSRLAFDFSALDRMTRSLTPRQRLLVLGTGEFMHPAFLLARHLETVGYDVRVQATTRSPILPGHAIQEVLRFTDNYGDELPNFLYNVARDSYDRVLICHETPQNANLLALAGLLNADLIGFNDAEISIS